MDISKNNFILAGQLKTSRVETLEDYLKERTKSLAIIGFMSPFATYNESRCTVYEQRIKQKEFSLPSFVIKKVSWWNKPLMIFSFFIYIFSFFWSVFRMHRKFDVFIGVATFSSMLGIILKKLGIANTVIYYCLDYYTHSKKLDFNRFVNLIYKHIDRWLVRKVDILWELSPRIKEGRKRYAGVLKDSYKSVIVPLGYSNNIHRDCPIKEREPDTLGFIGTLSNNQGLQMVARAMPKLIEKFPRIKLRVIGHGPYFAELKNLIEKIGIEDRFIFHGFIKNNEEVYDILSCCMAGLATWTGDETDNSIYADPGKPKLYALLGLPIIITKAPYISELISELGAGIVIDYNEDDFVLAVEKIIVNEKSFQTYRDGVERFKPYCLAENIFNEAFKYG